MTESPVSCLSIISRDHLKVKTGFFDVLEGETFKRGRYKTLVFYLFCVSKSTL